MKLNVGGTIRGVAFKIDQKQYAFKAHSFEISQAEIPKLYFSHQKQMLYNLVECIIAWFKYTLYLCFLIFWARERYRSVRRLPSVCELPAASLLVNIII